MPKSRETVTSSDDSDSSDSGKETKKKHRREKEEKVQSAQSSDESDSSSGKATKRKHKREKEKEDKAKSHKKAKKSKEDEAEPSWDIGKNRFVKIRKFNGKLLIDIREMYTDASGELKPGKKGIAMNMEQWKKFMDCVEEVDKVAQAKC